ncbi:MAG: hypothetical protein KKC80_00435 [Candidatus Margulisbacteria bacterium]|nr:hypothetical protein [Candidatus Margulisiibacteriota bacterium]MBU1616326.1 hypothetical protein [Candidatus Margulisiibacteriota bacterium]MBU1867785.1 hypothetical protein [Candidatus Margulisiibacteriota bacterium]
MKKTIVLLVSVVVLASGSFALQPALCGGIRDGAALGLILQEYLGSGVALRFGMEGNTGRNPMIAFAGGKFALSSIGRMPLSLGLGIVGYFGNNDTKAGLALSFIFDNAFGRSPMFIEAGIDIVDPAKLQLQLGYKF